MSKSESEAYPHNLILVIENIYHTINLTCILCVVSGLLFQSMCLAFILTFSVVKTDTIENKWS